jgi:hypothetical protein
LEQRVVCGSAPLLPSQRALSACLALCEALDGRRVGSAIPRLGAAAADLSHDLRVMYARLPIKRLLALSCAPAAAQALKVRECHSPVQPGP